MKNLDYYDEPLDAGAYDPSTYISLALREFPGGRIAKDEIDVIQEFPKATEIAIRVLC
jgi:hypothetical protein